MSSQREEELRADLFWAKQRQADAEKNVEACLAKLRETMASLSAAEETILAIQNIAEREGHAGGRCFDVLVTIEMHKARTP